MVPNAYGEIRQCFKHHKFITSDMYKIVVIFGGSRVFRVGQFNDVGQFNGVICIYL